MREIEAELFEIKFQSSPSPKAGSYVQKQFRHPLDNVSILSQPEGRELHSLIVARLASPVFQSSPSPKAGSYQTATG